MPATDRDIIEDIDETGTDKPAIARRLTRIANIVDKANRRLVNISQVLIPDGPPIQPEIIAALNLTIARATFTIQVANKILNPSTPGDISTPP